MSSKYFLVTIFLIFLLLPSAFIAQTSDSNSSDAFTIVLDAGHGGHDPGNLGNGYLEKNIALNIVLNVGAILKEKKDINVIYTRKDDTFIDLFVRGEIANKANADLFVSVHCDSHTSDAHGAGTFVLGLHANKQNFEIAKKENSVIYLEDNYESRYADYDINSPESVIGLTIMQEEFLDQSISLAKTIQDNFTLKLKRKNREVKQAGFIVLHQTFMPSVLVETGFLTNDDEGAYLNSERGQKEMGSSIANAIIEYKNSISINVIQSAPHVMRTTPDPEKEAIVTKPIINEPIDDSAVIANTNIESVVKEEELKVLGKIEDEIEAKSSVVNPELVIENKDKKSSVAESEVAKNMDVPAVSKDIDVEKKEVKDKITSSSSVVAKKTVVNAVQKAEPLSTNLVFKVQLMATVKVIPLEPSEFKGLDNLSKEPVKNLFRYMYGRAKTFKEAKLLKANADKKGYSTSYIVAYKDGERIAISDAIKLVSE